MELLFVSFFAGILTILAPCVLPMLPVIIGGSLAEKGYRRPLIITVSLALSIFVFTLLLKASTLLIDIPQSVWTTISGGIILFFGLITLFPSLWENISLALGFGSHSQGALQKAGQKKGITGEILIGAALGPVFASCSPTYFLILATVLPVSFVSGVLYLFMYALGLALVLFAIAALGQRFLAGAKWAANPHGIFKKILGVLFVFVGLAILTGFDKTVEIFFLDLDYGVTGIEEKLLEGIKE